VLKGVVGNAYNPSRLRQEDPESESSLRKKKKCTTFVNIDFMLR
jgi:hypothetical protein